MSPRRALAIGRLLGREAWAIAVQGRLIARARGRAEPLPDAARTVLFVHGFLAAGPVFDPMRAHVERALGVGTADFTYGSSREFESIAADLMRRIELLAGRTERVSIVGHSLGGLLSRWCLQELGAAPLVDRVVMLATPHAGTRSARLAFGPLGDVLRPGSQVVHRLAARRHAAANVRHVAIVAGADMMITPPESAAAIEGAEVFWFAELGHNELLFHDGVREVVSRALR